MNYVTDLLGSASLSLSYEMANLCPSLLDCCGEINERCYEFVNWVETDIPAQVVKTQIEQSNPKVESSTELKEKITGQYNAFELGLALAAECVWPSEKPQLADLACAMPGALAHSFGASKEIKKTVEAGVALGREYLSPSKESQIIPKARDLVESAVASSGVLPEIQSLVEKGLNIGMKYMSSSAPSELMPQVCDLTAEVVASLGISKETEGHVKAGIAIVKEYTSSSAEESKVIPMTCALASALTDSSGLPLETMKKVKKGIDVIEELIIPSALPELETRLSSEIVESGEIPFEAMKEQIEEKRKPKEKSAEEIKEKISEQFVVLEHGISRMIKVGAVFNLIYGKKFADSNFAEIHTNNCVVREKGQSDEDFAKSKKVSEANFRKAIFTQVKKTLNLEKDSWAFGDGISSKISKTASWLAKRATLSMCFLTYDLTEVLLRSGGVGFVISSAKEVIMGEGGYIQKLEKDEDGKFNEELRKKVLGSANVFLKTFNGATGNARALGDLGAAMENLFDQKIAPEELSYSILEKVLTKLSAGKMDYVSKRILIFLMEKSGLINVSDLFSKLNTCLSESDGNPSHTLNMQLIDKLSLVKNILQEKNELKATFDKLKKQDSLKVFFSEPMEKDPKDLFDKLKKTGDLKGFMLELDAFPKEKKCLASFFGKLNEADNQRDVFDKLKDVDSLKDLFVKDVKDLKDLFTNLEKVKGGVVGFFAKLDKLDGKDALESKERKCLGDFFDRLKEKDGLNDLFDELYVAVQNERKNDLLPRSVRKSVEDGEIQLAGIKKLILSPLVDANADLVIDLIKELLEPKSVLEILELSLTNINSLLFAPIEVIKDEDKIKAREKVGKLTEELLDTVVEQQVEEYSLDSIPVLGNLSSIRTGLNKRIVGQDRMYLCMDRINKKIIEFSSAYNDRRANQEEVKEAFILARAQEMGKIEQDSVMDEKQKQLIRGLYRDLETVFKAKYLDMSKLESVGNKMENALNNRTDASKSISNGWVQGKAQVKKNVSEPLQEFVKGGLGLVANPVTVHYLAKTVVREHLFPKEGVKV